MGTPQPDNPFPQPDIPFGARLKNYRKTVGLTRPVLAGLVGRSPEWVKGVECGRLQIPRLPMLLRIQDVLGIKNLADLTGDQRLTTATFGKTSHEQLPSIAHSLAIYPVIASPTDEPDVAGFITRVQQVWDLWHGARHHRTAIADLLPGLLHDAQTLPRHVDNNERRAVLTAQAQAYHLTQLYLSFQPVPELVHLTGDRAMTAAQNADDPQAMAAAAWYLNHVFRDEGQQHAARVQLAMDTTTLLSPERDVHDRALYGLLHLAAALSHAKTGRDGDAWRHWDIADDTVNALPSGYRHPWLMFGRSMVDAYAITMLNDLQRPGEAAKKADRVDLQTMPSATRRSFHTIEIARAYYTGRDHIATIALLRRAEQESPETARFNLFTRATVAELAESGGHTVRGDARELADAIGVAT